MSDAHETWQSSYLRRVCREPLLTKEQEKKLAYEVLAGSASAREKMISANLRLVVKIVGGYTRPGLDPLDLVSEGTKGLMCAVSKYRPDVGAKFSTYASFWIHQSIRRYMDAFLLPWRISSSARERLNKLVRISHQCSEALGRDPTPAEIAAEIGLLPSEVEAILSAGLRPVSLDSEVSTGAKIADVIPSQSPDPTLLKNDQNDAIAVIGKLLPDLSSREKAIIVARFGLGGTPPKTLEEIGKKHKLTRERIRQIEAKALRRLRKANSRLNNGTLS